jgi:hypothetical protein
MTTSEPASNGGWESPALPSMSWPEGSPASPFRSRAGGKPRATSGGSGRPWRPSLVAYDPSTSSWRTSPDCLLPGLPMCSVTWPRSGSMRNGTVYPRPPSAPITDVTDCSWLPTPAASPGGFNQSPSPGAAIRPSLETMARTDTWPTPTARLGDAQRGLPSPELAASRYASGRRNLDDAVAMWPTPSASLGDHAGLVTPSKSREGGTLVEAVSARMWPTPTVKGNHNRAGLSAKSGDGLATAVNRDQWPTPTARVASRGAGWDGPGRPLSETAGGPLNPTWVELLMGFPLGWTDLDG